MKHISILLWALMAIGVCRAQTPPADFYVSSKDSDTWSGTLATPDAQAADVPFATLARARDAVRALKEKKSDDIVVLIREGTYELEKTVVFGLEDSGVGDSTVA